MTIRKITVYESEDDDPYCELRVDGHYLIGVRRSCLGFYENLLQEIAIRFGEELKVPVEKVPF